MACKQNNMAVNEAHVLVALSNIAYVILAYWLARRHFREFAWVVLVVAGVSTYFHLNPNQDWSFYLDCIIASLSSSLVFHKMLPYVIPSPLFVFTVGLIVTSAILWWESGNDREAPKYVWMHSAWHILTALGFFLLIQCTPIRTGEELGKLDLPLIAGKGV
jgi:hypothetical protein